MTTTVHTPSAGPRVPAPPAEFTSGGSTYDTLAAVATRLAILAVEDTLNDPSEERTTERITLVEHLMWFANAHGSTRPAAAVRRAMAGMLSANGRPGTPVLSVLEELQIAMAHTQ
ncbi:hypothetical protein E7744_05225 [Citricoccus sp. SGAir0253]|uniref:hypothetical protein n=1 Tax=Citricoccus sp. SGAir0253 TaxID=2567881 RepID=UPI0010CCC5EB|nr:hypothetical protein [Citricoccus sp. SGAir0253]QCU77667.1 hypothetical protein E7744_05225 [Citricoccus sp. SGAir0253]